MEQQVTVIVNGNAVTATVGMTLSEVIGGEKPCGGHGRCGKCKVIATGALSEISDAELKLISPKELGGNVRLACVTKVMGECTITSIAKTQKAQILTDGRLPEFELAPSFTKYGVAIDIGTTTLAARLYDATGKALSQYSCLNSQSAWGADVISRIEAALDGKAEPLADSIRKTLNEMIGALAADAHISAKEIESLVVTGNTVMLSLLTGESVEPFSHAPFKAERLFGETVAASSLSLTALLPDIPVYLPPCISAFVGADTSCALLATGLWQDSAVMVDIGTNGEMALWHQGKLTVCSTAAGPAFEGVGISMGMRGAPGAIDKVKLSEGKLVAHTIGEGTPHGICGSGLVDAVACLLESGELDESGYFDDDTLIVAAPVELTPQDIRMLQLAKSAICAGLVALLDAEKLSAQDVEKMFVAGGFGNYLNMENAAKIGLLPKNLSKIAHSVGNAALSGAAMLLLNGDFREQVEKLREDCTLLDLPTNPVFSDAYMMGMLLEEVE